MLEHIFEHFARRLMYCLRFLHFFDIFGRIENHFEGVEVGFLVQAVVGHCMLFNGRYRVVSLQDRIEGGLPRLPHLQMLLPDRIFVQVLLLKARVATHFREA